MSGCSLEWVPLGCLEGACKVSQEGFKVFSRISGRCQEGILRKFLSYLPKVDRSTHKPGDTTITFILAFEK